VGVAARGGEQALKETLMQGSGRHIVDRPTVAEHPGRARARGGGGQTEVAKVVAAGATGGLTGPEDQDFWGLRPVFEIDESEALACRRVRSEQGPVTQLPIGHRVTTEPQHSTGRELGLAAAQFVQSEPVRAAAVLLRQLGELVALLPRAGEFRW
jgi:hypothetical protein